MTWCDTAISSKKLNETFYDNRIYDMNRIRFNDFDIKRVVFDEGDKIRNIYTRYNVRYKYSNDFVADLRITTPTASSLLTCTYIGKDNFSGHTATFILDDDKFYTILASIGELFKEYINKKKGVNYPISEDSSKLYCKMIESAEKVYTEFYTQGDDSEIVTTPIEELKGPLMMRPIFTAHFIVGPTINMKVQIYKSYYKKVERQHGDYDLAFKD
jgi:hypothetical protein